VTSWRTICVRLRAGAAGDDRRRLVGPEVASAVRHDLRGWYKLLTDVAERALDRLGGLGPFTPAEGAALAGNAFLGAEALILLGIDERQVPSRAALRRVAALIKTAETR
jgi:hypothetical protein